jgi:hypothetical protein
MKVADALNTEAKQNPRKPVKEHDVCAKEKAAGRKVFHSAVSGVLIRAAHADHCSMRRLADTGAVAMPQPQM